MTTDHGIVFLLSYIAVVLVTPGLLLLLSLLKIPQWVKDSVLESSWKRINLIAYTSSVVISLANFFIQLRYDVFTASMTGLYLSILIFVFGQTVMTDFNLRHADRWVLRLSMVISFAIGLWYFSVVGDLLMTGIYLVLALLSAILIFVPGLGASDGRAIVLIVCSCLPVLGLQGFQYGFLALLGTIIVYGIYLALKHKSLRMIFSNKVSLPMVPILLFPFIVTIIVYTNILYLFVL